MISGDLIQIAEIAGRAFEARLSPPRTSTRSKGTSVLPPVPSAVPACLKFLGAHAFQTESPSSLRRWYDAIAL